MFLKFMVQSILLFFLSQRLARDSELLDENEEEERVIVVCEGAGQCRVPARLLPLQRCEGKGAEGARLCVKYAPSCSCQVSTK